MTKKSDYILGIIFAVATVIFVIIFLTNDIFFSWAFERHHNILSWYIRLLFIIPMVVFAFKKSYTGIFASIFAKFDLIFVNISALISSFRFEFIFLAFKTISSIF